MHQNSIQFVHKYICKSVKCSSKITFQVYSTPFCLYLTLTLSLRWDHFTVIFVVSKLFIKLFFFISGWGGVVTLAELYREICSIRSVRIVNICHTGLNQSELFDRYLWGGVVFTTKVCWRDTLSCLLIRQFVLPGTCQTCCDLSTKLVWTWITWIFSGNRQFSLSDNNNHIEI